jgi:hypothetical protein
MRRRHLKGGTVLSAALVALDRALTGREPEAMADCRHLTDVMSWLDHGIVYLSDGGYSRIGINTDVDPFRVFLCIGARQQVRDAWETATAEREAVNAILRAACDEWR